MAQTLTGSVGVAYVGQLTAPSPGDPITAASVYLGEQALLDDASFLNASKADRAGDTFSGPVEIDSTLHVTGDTQIDGDVAATADLSVTGTTLCLGPLQHDGYDRWLAQVTKADATPVNVAATASDRFLLSPPASSPRIVVVADGVDGMRIQLFCPPDALGSGDGQAFTVKRADATVIADLYVCTVKVGGLDRLMGSMVEIEVAGGVWRGVSDSGIVDRGAGW